MLYNRKPSYLSLKGSAKLHLSVFHSRLPDKPTLPSPLDPGNLNYISLLVAFQVPVVKELFDKT